MAGITVDGGGVGRRSLDSEINMIPMIDLLMVTISFLLITAVWVQSARLEASANVPGPPSPVTCEGPACAKEARLHVDARDPSKFRLDWKVEGVVVRSSEVAREPRVKGSVAYSELASRVREEWNTTGLHKAKEDRLFDHAVVHTSNDASYSDVIAVMDAVSSVKRPAMNGDKTANVSAFETTFATD